VRAAAFANSPVAAGEVLQLNEPGHWSSFSWLHTPWKPMASLATVIARLAQQLP
jgi:hypothetical protein